MKKELAYQLEMLKPAFQTVEKTRFSCAEFRIVIDGYNVMFGPELGTGDLTSDVNKLPWSIREIFKYWIIAAKILQRRAIRAHNLDLLYFHGF